MRRSTTIGAVIALGVGGVFGGYFVARAAGPTSPVPLYYSGFLTLNGLPVNTPTTIQVSIFAAASGGSPQCQSSAGASVPLDQGHFTVDLVGCESVFKANGATWVEVDVNGVPVGARQPVGATPYAVSAEQASSADTATTAMTATTATNASTAASLVFSVGATKTSVGIPCGTTAAKYNGALATSMKSGYVQAASLCQAVAGCKADAHMCSSDEVARFTAAGGFGQDGKSGTSGWISTFSPSTLAADCVGWTDSTSGHGGVLVYIDSIGARPNAVGCDQQYPIQCCSSP